MKLRGEKQLFFGLLVALIIMILIGVMVPLFGGPSVSNWQMALALLIMTFVFMAISLKCMFLIEKYRTNRKSTVLVLIIVVFLALVGLCLVMIKMFFPT